MNFLLSPRRVQFDLIAPLSSVKKKDDIHFLFHTDTFLSTSLYNKIATLDNPWKNSINHYSINGVKIIEC